MTFISHTLPLEKYANILICFTHVTIWKMFCFWNFFFKFLTWNDFYEIIYSNKNNMHHWGLVIYIYICIYMCACVYLSINIVSIGSDIGFLPDGTKASSHQWVSPTAPLDISSRPSTGGIYISSDVPFIMYRVRAYWHINPDQKWPKKIMNDLQSWYIFIYNWTK